VMLHFEFSSLIENAINQRLSHPDYLGTECVRLLHDETTLLRIDKYGSVLAIYWYIERPPLQSEQNDFDRLASCVGAEQWIVYPKQKQQTFNGSEIKESFSWQAPEHGIMYELRSNHGASPGLFLDQRQQRLWALQNTDGKRVLNLFCYTSGFTLNALKGGAQQVTSVDISASALAWSRSNVLKNDLDVERTVFLKDDSRQVLKRSLARGTRYDIVVCDPPTFSRGKGAVFSLKREFRKLLRACSLVVEPGGHLLFSTNFEGMSPSEFEATIWQELGPTRMKQVTLYKPTYDYSGSAEWELKSCLISFDG
jgi:23S rRNA (cytosine1962-C5)-methyltransferase